MTDRKTRRQSAIAARKAATKARLAEPPTPPQEPVALPWRREPRRSLPVDWSDWSFDNGQFVSPVVSHSAADLESSLTAIGSFVTMLGPVLRARRAR